MKQLQLKLLILSLTMISCTNKTPNSPRVNHVALQVSDMTRSITFYTTIFDLNQTNTIKKISFSNSNGEFNEFDGHIVFLKFPGQDFVYELIENKQQDTVSKSPRFIHVGFDVENIDVTFQKALDIGAEILVPIRTVKAGGVVAKQAFFKGPDGESIELMEMISGNF